MQALVIPSPAITFRGRASTFRTPGRAGTANQNLSALWNGSTTKVCRIRGCGVDLLQQATKALTVIPPVIRFYRFTTAPTGGTTATKNAVDTNLSSDANVLIYGDASADGTSSAAAIAVTTSGGSFTQEFAPRLLTSGTTPATNLYEMFDKEIYFDVDDVVVRPSQGILLRLDYTVATANPTTDMWVVNWLWTEE
jgi:hypothetical protein